MVLGACAVLIEACSQQAVVLPSRDFDRPTDIAFGCIGIFKDSSGAVALSGQPMDRCHPPGLQDPKPGTVDATGAQYRTYGFMTNSGRGDLSVIDLGFCRSNDGVCYPPGADLVDLDDESPGFTAAPVGELPEVVASSQDGCRVVTANRGSCDLTLVDPSVLLAKKWGGVADPRDGLLSVTPHTSTGQVLNVSPAEIAFLPQQTAALSGKNEASCTALGTLAAPVGAESATEMARASWHVVVTFPSCDLIALIDLPSGDILDSYRLTGAGASGYGYLHTGKEPTCPRTDCGERAALTCPASGAGGGAAGGDSGQGGMAGGGGSGAVAALPDAGGQAVDALAGAGGMSGQGVGGGGATGEIGGPGGDAGGPGGLAGGPGGDAGAPGGAGGTASAVVVTSAAAPACPGLGVSALALRPSGTRLYFGANNVPMVGALDIQGGNTLVEPTSGKNTSLQGAGGVLRLRLSVDPFDYIAGHDASRPSQPEYGKFVSAVNPDLAFEFLYVIARDSTLRVVDVSVPAPVECDLSVDPTDERAHATVTRTISGEQVTETVIPRPTPCFPVGASGGPASLPYWAGVDPHIQGGPGLHFPSPAVDIAVGNFLTAELKSLTSTVALTVAANESVVNGAYGFVLTSSGLIYVLNIDPVLRKTAQFVRPDVPGAARVAARVTESPIPLVNSLRDSGMVTYSTALGVFSGAPRLDTEPLQTSQGPRLREFQPADPNINTTDSSINARAVPLVDVNGNVSESNTPLSTFVYFPNRFLARPQTWQVTWEGPISGTRFSGILDAPPDPSAFALRDPSAPFCGVGILPGDIVTLVGCQQDADCPTRVCVRSQRIPTTVDGRTIDGLCLPPRMAAGLRDGQCRDVLESFRRYEVTRATQSQLTLHPRMVEYPRPAHGTAPSNLDTCDPTKQTPECTGTDDCPASYCCQAVEPIENQPNHRCVRTCAASTSCGQGAHCHQYATGRFCAEGADIDLQTQLACLDQLAIYKINAGNTFVVTGSVAGRPDVVTPRPADQACTGPELAAANLRVSRIPMTTPTCIDPLPAAWSDVDLARVKSGTNPATPWVPTPNPCVVQPDAAKTVKTANVWFQNGEVRFVLENFDQPFPFTGITQMTFDVHGGLAPLQVAPLVDAAPTLPSRIIVGPVSALQQVGELTPNLDSGFIDPTLMTAIPESDFPYLYVVDQRQYSAGRLIGRGQLLRLHPRVSSIAPGFEGISTSNSYFPIQ
jgi:hypothetical protein